MNRHLPLPGLIIAAMICASSVAASQAVHVHGQGRINIAIEGDRLFMELESPGADIVGFEHAASSAGEKAMVAAAIEQLDDPMQLLRFDPAAACEVRQASASLEGYEDEHEEHDEQETRAGHDEHADQEAHGSFIAEYEFACADMNELEFIEFRYFDRFVNAQSLEVVLIDGRGQRRLEVERTDPVLRLAR